MAVVQRITDLSLSVKMGIIVGSLTLIALIGVSSELMTTFRRHSRLAVLTEANTAGDHLLRAAAEQARERGFTSSVLANPADTRSHAAIPGLRSRGDGLLDSAITVSTDMLGSDAAIRVAYERLCVVRRQRDDLRLRVDNELGRSAAPPELIRQWIAAQTALISQEQVFSRTLLVAHDPTEQILEMNHVIKSAVFAASEYAGRERANVGAAIGSGKPIDPVVHRHLMEYRGVVNENIARILVYADQPQASPNVKAAIAGVRNVFLTDFEELRQSVYAASAASRAYPVTGPEWMARSTAGINALLGVSSAVSADVQGIAADASDLVRTRLIVAFLLALVLLCGCVLSVWLSRTMVMPLRRAAAYMQELGSGRLFERLRLGRRDEIGVMADAMDSFADNLEHTMRKVSRAVSATASASAEISASTKQMASGAQQQTTQTAEVAGAVEEMAKTILENSRNAGEASDTAQHARASAEQGGKVVDDTVNGMKRIAGVVHKSAETVRELGKSSQQIGEIVSVINEIAEQTNLLALNAAIEAARAGEQGRGFAVVADEVRKLADRTTQATKEIAGMIKKIQEDTSGAVRSMQEGTEEVERGIALADKAGRSLDEIVTVSQRVTDMVATIAAASEQQSTASEQITRNVEAISTVTGETAQGTQQIAITAEDLNRLTEDLQSLVDHFTFSEQADGDRVVPSGARTVVRSHRQMTMTEG